MKRENLKLLLINDNDEEDFLLTRKLLQKIPETSFHLDWVDSWDNGLISIRQQLHDAYLIDHELGSHDGLELLRKADIGSSRAPAIVLTGDGGLELDLKAMSAGASDFICKSSLNAEVLGRAIRYAIAHKRVEQQLRVLNQIARLVNGPLDLRSVLDAAAKGLSNTLIAERFAIFVCSNDEPLTLNLFFEHDRFRKNGNSDLRHSFRLAGTRFEQCFERREPMYSADLENEEGSALLTLISHGIHSEVLVPIVHGERKLGALAVGRARKDGFTQSEVDFLRQVGDHLSIAINNSCLYAELQDAYEELKKSREQVVQQERLRALGTMASGIAHDFNNVLSPISGFSELLLVQPELRQDETRLLKILQTIHTASEDAAHIVRRLREFYRHRDPDEFAKMIDLNELVEESVTITQPRWKDQAMERGGTIVIESDLHASNMFSGNESEIREALINLILNATDAIDRDGTISIRTQSTSREVFCEISDNGAGMSVDTQKKCFEPFFTTKGERGTGMGLSMVFGVVERHEGGIEVESSLGQGTTFKIRLPIRSQSAKRNTALNEKAVSKVPRHVLVVDDELPIRTVVSEYLEAFGHTVETAASAKEALEKFQTERFDVVITDRGMPVTNGDQLALKIKQISPKQPIAMLTGFGEMMKLSDELPAGIDVVVSKPVTMSALLEALSVVTKELEPETPVVTEDTVIHRTAHPNGRSRLGIAIRGS